VKFSLLIKSLMILIGLSPIKLWASVPDFIPETTLVNAESLIDLAEQHENLIIIDARIKSDREQGFIEGSFSLPDITTNCQTLKVIIPQKITPSLFYCNGVKCGRSVKAIVIAKKCGYSNIYWFRGGFEEWSQKGYPVAID